MDARDRAFLNDYLAAVVWPAMRRTIASAGQTVFATRGSWDTTHDIARAWVNGAELDQAVVAWDSASAVAIPAQLAGAVVIVLVVPGGAAGYLPRSGAAAMTGDFDAGGHRLRHLQASVDATDAVRREEVAGLASAAGNANYLRRDGTNAPTQAIGWGGNRLHSLGAATNAGDAVRRDQVPLRDGSQGFTHPVAGEEGDQPEHLATRGFVQSELDELAGMSIPQLAFTKGLVMYDSPTATSFVVPADVYYLGVALMGAGGGAGSAYVDSQGGYGGVCTAVLKVDPEDVLAVRCGTKGEWRNFLQSASHGESSYVGDVVAEGGQGTSGSGKAADGGYSLPSSDAWLSPVPSWGLRPSPRGLDVQHLQTAQALRCVKEAQGRPLGRRRIGDAIASDGEHGFVAIWW